MADPTSAAALTGLVPDLDPVLADRLVDGLAAVDARMRQVVDHEDPFISEAAGHLARAGGKRFRPLLTLLAAEVGDGWNTQVVDAAVAVELTHLASLYHDDVMDEARLRRGVDSANTRYGNSLAVLVGDLLFGTASSVVAGLGADAVRIQAETFVRLCAGQIRDERQRDGDGPPVDPAAFYLAVLEDKTGALIATAARYGAMFGGCDPLTVRTLSSYGDQLGLAFQLADDVLDITSDAADSGKVPGADLREGKATLPVLHLRASSDPADAALQRLTAGPISDPEQLEQALSQLRGHPALERARDQTKQVADEARSLLALLPDRPAVTALRALVDGVADRSR